jgi:hypothetical protein
VRCILDLRPNEEGISEKWDAGRFSEDLADVDAGGGMFSMSADRDADDESSAK